MRHLEIKEQKFQLLVTSKYPPASASWHTKFFCWGLCHVGCTGMATGGQLEVVLITSAVRRLINISTPR